MTPNPIHKVLSTLSSHNVQFLLMGGQACVFYGAAEFSRDTDIVLLAESENLLRLQQALKALMAECIAVPALTLDFLLRGHAVHFRCHHPEAEGIRIDVMSRLRGVEEFPVLWARRTTIVVDADTYYDLLSLPDLVQAKKTQRDKDWPMLRRLVESHYAQFRENPTAQQVRFWLAEARTPALLVSVAGAHPEELAEQMRRRPLLRHAAAADPDGLERALAEEEKAARDADRRYWAPLRRELEQLRHLRLKP